MNKLWLIIKREYLVRVKKKSFLLVTLLTPLAFAVLMVGAGVMTAYMAEKSSKLILVKDDSGIFEKYETRNTNNRRYVFSNVHIDSLTDSYLKDGFEVLVFIPPYNDTSNTIGAEYHYRENPGMTTIDKIESDISEAFRDYKIEQSNIDRDILNSFYFNVNMKNAEELKKGRDDSGNLSMIIASGLSMVMGFLLYMVIFIFGTMVMRSVMEEKINRIVEIMISSVKPFQLMMGKVIGVGAVGLTQLAIWIIVIPLILMIVGLFFGGAAQQGVAGMEQQIDTADIGSFNIASFSEVFFSLNWGLILPSFIVFFLGGFFLYSSMFAGIGAAVGDDQGESQSLIWPVTVPVIMGFMIMINTVNDPNSPLAVFGSFFPLFSPLVMPARLPFNPPVWHIVVSAVILILTCMFFIWISAKIYRGGILLYGKKLTLKDMGKILINRF